MVDLEREERGLSRFFVADELLDPFIACFACDP